jgi:hypothetical protein
MKYLILLTFIAGIGLQSMTGGPAGVISFDCRRVLLDTLPPGDSVLVGRMIQKLTDSLSLTTDQQIQIGQICYLFDSSRLSILRQYRAMPDSLGRNLTWWNRGRDSCFMNVLSEDQYRLYGQKKSMLVLNN